MATDTNTSAPADAEATLAELFAAHRARLERIAAPLLRGSGVAAEDVVGDVFVRLAELLAVRPLPAGAEPAAYLTQMVRHRCFDLQRRRARWGESGLEDDTRLAPAGSAEDAALRRERFDALLEDLALLPDRQRQALLDRCVAGASHAEIAARHDVSEQTSRSLCSRALTNLRALREARDAPCELVRVDLGTARARGVRPAEDVRRHLRVCAPCRLADARARGAGMRDRAVATLAGWFQLVAELLHGAAVAPVTKTLAVGATAVAPVVGIAPAPAPAPERAPAAAHVVAPRAVAASAAVPAPVRRATVRRTAPSVLRVRAPRPASAARPAVRLDTAARAQAYRQTYARARAGAALTAADREVVERACASFGAKGLVGPAALTARCDPVVLDTPQRRAKVERVENWRARDAARKERERAAAERSIAAAPDPAPAPAVPVAPPEPVPAAAPAPAPAAPAPPAPAPASEPAPVPQPGPAPSPAPSPDPAALAAPPSTTP